MEIKIGETIEIDGQKHVCVEDMVVNNQNNGCKICSLRTLNMCESYDVKGYCHRDKRSTKDSVHFELVKETPTKKYLFKAKELTPKGIVTKRLIVTGESRPKIMKEQVYTILDSIKKNYPEFTKENFVNINSSQEFELDIFYSRFFTVDLIELEYIIAGKDNSLDKEDILFVLRNIG